MKDSGNKWLGKIPAHWDLVYLWQICAEQKNKNSQNQENNVLSLSHGNIIRKKDLNYGLVPKDYVGYQIVEPGNIILRLTDLQEQKKIVDFVDTKCASVGFEIDRMIEQLKQEIALLGQYKTQMAADIITGRTNLSEIDYALISDVPTDHTEEVAEDAE